MEEYSTLKPATNSARCTGSLGYLLRSQADGRQLLDKLQHYSFLSSSYDRLMVDCSSTDTVAIRLVRDVTLNNNALDCGLKTVHAYRLLSEVFGEDKIVHVVLDRPAEEVDGPFTTFFKGKATFGGVCPTFFLDQSVLDMALPERDDILAQSIETLAQRLGQQAIETSIVQKVAFLLRPEALGPSATLNDLAKEICMSPRTLQRRLSEEDVSFNAIVDQARKEQALALLLCSRLPIPDIAEELGFVELSSFYRAFRIWYNDTPARFRSMNKLATSTFPALPALKSEDEPEPTAA